MILGRRGFLAGAAGLAGSAVLVDRHERSLRAAARSRGLVYGSSTATWQLADHAYARLFDAQAATLFTEDDLLWYRIRPTPHAALDFGRADRIVGWAERTGHPVMGAHLVWDQGFGPGWRGRRLWDLPAKRAHALLFGTIEHTVARYKGRVSTWSCANEVVAPSPDDGHHGLRTDVPWFGTCGPRYVEHAFAVAHAADPRARLVLNDFGHETVDPYGRHPEAKRRATIEVLDRLLERSVPVHAVGLQAHLYADRFAQRFDRRGYARFLTDLADRGLDIMITELDVLDDGLPPDVARRDRAVADVYRRYLEVALAEPAVSTVLTFGLSDRYTWLQQDDPRADGARRRPLPYDRRLQRTPAFTALHHCLTQAPSRPRRDALGSGPTTEPVEQSVLR